MDARIKAVRDNKLVGRGTCTYANECFSDEELLAEITCSKGPDFTEKDAIDWCIWLQDLKMDQMLGCRFGDDSDDELNVYREWRDQCEAYEAEQGA
tara:strand:- start:264 stop:551 length:288 start_codon:yes stop_codon:yes gene_type:complete